MILLVIGVFAGALLVSSKIRYFDNWVKRLLFSVVVTGAFIGFVFAYATYFEWGR